MRPGPEGDLWHGVLNAFLFALCLTFLVLVVVRCAS
jgi:hypothetical protein